MHFIFNMFQVNLGVIKENPSSLDGVIRILQDLQQYVPRCPDGRLFPILCHGDELSIERHTDAKRARSGSETPEGRLDGLEQSPQEFHKRMLLLQVRISHEITHSNCM